MWKLMFSIFSPGEACDYSKWRWWMKEDNHYVLVVGVIIIKVLQNVLLSFVSMYHLKIFILRPVPGYYSHHFLQIFLILHMHVSKEHMKSRSRIYCRRLFCLTITFLHGDIDRKKIIFFKRIVFDPFLTLCSFFQHNNPSTFMSFT